MTARVLPVDEWPQLADTDFGPILDRLNPDAVTILVIEDQGAIVGCWSLIYFAHVEGLWVAPSHRKRGRVLVRLWNAMRTLARGRGLEAVYTGALATAVDVQRLLASRQAEALPPMYALPLAALKEK